MRYNFTSNQPETRITSKLVDILEEMRYGWTIEVEANPFTVGSKKLDAFVTEHGREPIAIEAKYADTHTEEKLQEQAVSRLVRELVPDRAYDSVTNTLNNVMGIRYPVRFKTEAGRDLRQVLFDADDLQYKLVSNAGHMVGFSAYFVDLADKKLKRGGTMGFILPATILAGTSMQKVRDVSATEYHNVTVITIVQAETINCVFPSSTKKSNELSRKV